MFELLERDACGRIGEFTVGKHKITTPTIAIVINPNRQTIPLDIMKKIGVELIITNSYIIHRKEETRKIFSKQGLHKTLKWDGPIYTDSGTFQMFSRALKDLPNKQIINFQKKMGSDIITPVDLFTIPKEDLKTAKRKLTETIKRIKEAKRLTNGNFVCPIQGGRHIELRKQACKKLSKIEPLVYAIGGLVPYMAQYRFSKLAEIITTCKQTLPAHVPIHAFGAGHPMVFAFLTALGCDLFDSAMYSLAAQRGAYLTVNGTLTAKDLKEFPCTCPACSCSTVKEFKSSSLYAQEKFLTLHNLYVTIGEIRTIREAIRNDRLWELVQQRARAHPKLLEALENILKKSGKDMIRFERISKSSALFYSGNETHNRPEVLSAIEKAKLNGKKHKHPFWGNVPLGLRGTYPFSQSVVPGGTKFPICRPSQQIKTILDYQFGKGASKKFTNLQIEVSKKTQRLRRIRKKGVLLGTIRPSDGIFIPTFAGAKLLGKYIKKIVVKDKEVVGFIRIGKSLFSRFAFPSKGIRPREEIMITFRKKPLAIGTALLSSEEMTDFKRGMAVKIRKTV
jgi:7-cyano-7-deazaguanine tRNA-ribosyltransferase